MWLLSWVVAGFGGGSGPWLSRALRPPPKVGGRTVRFGARSRLRPRRAVVAQAPRPPVGWRSRRRSLGLWWEQPHTERGFFVGGAGSRIEAGGKRPLPKALGGFLTFSHSARQPPALRPHIALITFARDFTPSGRALGCLIGLQKQPRSGAVVPQTENHSKLCKNYCIFLRSKPIVSRAPKRTRAPPYAHAHTTPCPFFLACMRCALWRTPIFWY